MSAMERSVFLLHEASPHITDMKAAEPMICIVHHSIRSECLYSLEIPCHIHRDHSSSLERSIGSSHILFFGFGGPSSAVLSLKVVPRASGSVFSAGFWLSSAIFPTCSDKLSAPSRAGFSGCCIFAPWPPPPALINGAT